MLILCTAFIGVDGSWSDWSEFSECSTTCGSGSKRRSRSCDSPAPQGDGKACEGDQDETVECISHSCAGKCSTSCSSKLVFSKYSNKICNKSKIDYKNWTNWTKKNNLTGALFLYIPYFALESI